MRASCMKRSIVISLLYISFLSVFSTCAMMQEGHQYDVSVAKIDQDKFKIRMSKMGNGAKQSCSFITNFATRTCDDQKNLFAPFDIPMRFGNAADADSFLWDVPDFGLLKLHHDGSTFFGHSPHEIPLATDALTLHTSGELFLQTLRVAALHLGSKKTHLCEMLVADAISTEDQVYNSGSLQTSRLLGGGTFCNEGVVEFRGNQHDPALLGIKEFVNQSNEHRKPTVHASHLTATRDNQKIINKKNTEFEVSEKLIIDEPSAQDALLQNKGLFKTGVCDAQRTITNEGFLQANKLTARKLLENDQFGQIKILDEISVEDLANGGEIDAHKSIDIIKGVNKGSISGAPTLTMRVHSDLENCGNIRLQQLLGGGRVLNRKSLRFYDNASITIQDLTNYSLLKAASASLIHTKLSNTVTGIVELLGKSRIGNTTIHNNGNFLMQGDVDFSEAKVYNRSAMVNRDGALNCTNMILRDFVNKATGTWTIERMKSVRPFEMNNEGILELTDSSLGFELMRNYKDLFMRGGACTFKKLINSGVVQTGLLHLIPSGLLQNLQGGSFQVFEKSVVDNAEIINDGDLVMQGDTDFISAKVYNRNGMTNREGALNCTNMILRNLDAGKWLMERVKSGQSISMHSQGVLELAENSLDFDLLRNDKDLILHGGSYRVKDFRNKKLQLGGNSWAVTDNPAEPAPNKLVLISPHIREQNLGEIEAEHDLNYDLAVMPSNLRAENITTPEKRLWNANQLKKLTTSGKVTAWCDQSTFVNGNFAFPNIGHLDLFFNKPLTIHGSLIAPILSLHVNGTFSIGKSNEELGTIAATYGPLTVTADRVAGWFAKLYGKGKADIIATKDDVIIGTAVRGVDEETKQQFANGWLSSTLRRDFLASGAPSYPPDPIPDQLLSVRNGAYAASDDFLTLRAAKKVHLNYGVLFSALGTHLAAPTEVLNHAAKISSHGPITIESDLYTHARSTPAHKIMYATSSDGQRFAINGYAEYPGSVSAVVESLKKITFKTKKITNYASSIRSASSIILNGKDVLTPATGYIEAPQHYYHYCPSINHRDYLFSQACTLQSGKNIQMNLGDFVVAGNWNAPGVINILGRNGLFSNGGALTRETANVTGPIVVDVTQHMLDEARRPGFYRVAHNGAVETEFPFGAPSAPQPGDLVALENPQHQTPLNWHNIFNPLRSIDLNLPLQQLLSKFANKTYAGRARGNQTATVLWGNANRWRQRNAKEIMSPADLQQADESMLISQIVPVGLTQQQRTLLCIAREDVNRHKDAIVAGEFRAVTQGDQVHLNDQIIAKSPGGITIESQAGNVTLATQSHTIEYGDADGAWVTEQRAYPQQQFIAEVGPVDVTAHYNLSRVGTAIVAGTTAHQQAQTGSFSNVPLTLQKMSEKTDVKDGLFSSKTTITTNVSHQILPSTTIAGATIYDQAADSIHAVATQDVAGQSITYESPNTVIEGIILADRTERASHSSSAFSEQSSTNMQEAPCAMAATIRAPQVRFVGNRAIVNANIAATELHDDTRDGIEFVAKVKEMLYSQQTLVDSPLMSLDAGCKGGYETMIPPMLMVDRIIRVSPIGQMLFQSAVIDKDRTAIIGRFVETTYHLKKWHEEWCHKDQAVSDEMLVAIAIAITIATDGMGAELLAITAENAVVAAMVNAGFSTLCATAGTSVLRTGDPLQTIEQLATPQFLKSFAIDVASAGLCQKLGSALKVPMGPGAKSLMGHVQTQALRNTVNALLNVAINNAPVGQSIGSACAQISLNAVAGYVSNNICGAYLNGIERKAAHSLLGGAIGFAKDGNSKGLASGAVGALTAETVGALLTEDAFAVSDAAIGRLRKDDKPLTQENIQKAVQEEVNYRMKIAKVASGTVAAMMKLNSSTAMHTAANVIDNDVAMRAQVYAMAEMTSLLTAASQTLATINSAGAFHEKESYPLDRGVFDGKEKDDHDVQDDRLDKKERKPFVEDPKRGIWIKGCISGDLVLKKGIEKVYAFLLKYNTLDKDERCPFALFAHGDSDNIQVDTQDIHPGGLSSSNQERLKEDGHLLVNAAELSRLIKTAPKYNGQHIILFSCQCGADAEGLAQQLADEMQEEVSAFTGYAAAPIVGGYFASIKGDTLWSGLEEIRTFYPRKKRITNYRLYP